MNLYRIFTGQGLFLTYITAPSRAKAIQKVLHRYPDATRGVQCTL